MVIPDPDLSKIRIHRVKNDQGEEEIIPVDWSNAVKNVTVDTEPGEVRKGNIELQWGDVVEINSRPGDRLLDWSGFDGQVRLFFTRMLTRGIKVQGWTSTGNEFKVSNGLELQPRFRTSTLKARAFVPGPARPQTFTSPFHAPYSSRTNWVKVILRSNGTTREFTPDQWGAVNPWLRDGDSIEVQTY